MGFARKIKPHIDAFIQELLDCEQKSTALSFKSQLKYFLRFMASQRARIECVSEVGRRDIERYIDYLWNVEYGANQKSAHLRRNSFVYRGLRAVDHFFQYLSTREGVIDKRHLPGPGLFLKDDFPSPNKRGVKHFPRWLEKLLRQKILALPESPPKRRGAGRPKKGQKVGRPKRERHLLDALRFKTILLLMYHTGARIKDACSLEANCLRERNGVPWLRIFSNKTKRFYEIPISLELKRALTRYMAENSTERRRHPTYHKEAEFLFWLDLDWTLGSFVRDTAIKIREFHELVLEQAKEDGHPVRDVAKLNLTAHKYRHTVAIRLIRMGADPMLVAEFLGHADLTMAQAYIQESEQEIDELMEELWNDDLLGLSEDPVDSFNFSRDDLYSISGVISKVECGHCAHIGDKPPCGEEGYDCWMCEKLEPDYDDPDYPDRLKEMLVDHQALRERNINLGHLGAAKVEQEVIMKIQRFMEMTSVGGCA